jgi:hypothetical protein
LTSFGVPDSISRDSPGTCSQKNQMFDLLIILAMVGIVVSLGFGLYFLVTDRGESDRTIWSLTFRVGFAVVLLIILAVGFMSRL